MSSITSFSQLGLAEDLLSPIAKLGYEIPTPVQSESIPILLEGHDLLAQAQTGTGKTAAFALPALSKIDVSIKAPQVLVLAPTRELAIQVAEAFQTYAVNLESFNAIAIYGGQNYNIQFKALKRGPQVIVGTPGRIMDHLRRDTLSLENIKLLVLDEADEMLNMGFIDDIEWILEHIKNEHQTALFSATLPKAIEKIAQRYQKNAKHVKITSKESSIKSIEQQYLILNNNQKLDALTRLLDSETFNAMMIFVRTKTETIELADKLKARGYSVAPLNGDIKQTVRQQVINQIKKGAIDIIVATDVAARGIDVDRITHVINYDVPHDAESYIHRIGRTGRAGRTGKTILFITPREERLLKNIERAVHSPIEKIKPPSTALIFDKKAVQLADEISFALMQDKKLEPFRMLLEKIIASTQLSHHDIASALLHLKLGGSFPPADLKPPKEGDKPAKKKSSQRRERFDEKPSRRRTFSKDQDRKKSFSKDRDGKKKPFDKDRGGKKKPFDKDTSKKKKPFDKKGGKPSKGRPRKSS